jgi:hypothetical protein
MCQLTISVARHVILILDRFELIEQAGLPGGFEAIDENPVWPEPDYGND